MVSSSPLAHLLLATLATASTASPVATYVLSFAPNDAGNRGQKVATASTASPVSTYALSFAPDDAGNRGQKGRLGRRVQGSVAPRKADRATAPASDLARDGGVRRLKGRAGRRARGTAASEKANKEAKGERVKAPRPAGRQRNKHGSSAAPTPTPAPARVAGLEHGGTPFPTDGATPPPAPTPSDVPAPLAEEPAAAVVSIPDVIAMVGGSASPTGAPTLYPTLTPTELQSGRESEPTAAEEQEEQEQEQEEEEQEQEQETVEEEEEGTGAEVAVVDPAAPYDELAWADLPAEVQDEMAVLGYTAELWDGGGVAAADDLTWEELDAAEREAAAALGYDEASWMAEDGEASVAAVPADDGDASGAATTAAPSGGPTYEPTRPAPPCPSRFDPTTEYAGGDAVAVSGSVFRCNPADDGAYVRYCNILHWDVGLLDYDPRAQDLWDGAWVYLGACTEEVADYEGASRL